MAAHRRRSAKSHGAFLRYLPLVGAMAIVSVAAGQQNGVPRQKADPPAAAGKKLEIKVEGKLTENDPPEQATGNPSKVHSFELTAGKTYALNLKSDDFDTFLRLLGPDGKQIAENDDAVDTDSRVIFRCEKSGKFSALVTAFDKGSGRYTLSLREFAYSAAKAMDIPKAGLTVNGVLNANDLEDSADPAVPSKLFAVRLKAGVSYTFTLRSNAFDAFLRLHGPDASLVTEDDDSGGDLDSQIVYRPTRDGVFFLVATHFDEEFGPFELSVQPEQK